MRLAQLPPKKDSRSQEEDEVDEAAPPAGGPQDSSPSGIAKMMATGQPTSTFIPTDVDGNKD